MNCCISAFCNKQYWLSDCIFPSTGNHAGCIFNFFLNSLFETKTSLLCTSTVVASLLFWKCWVFFLLAVMSLYWNKVHRPASSEWSLTLGCSEMIFYTWQNTHVQDAKIYLAEWPLLPQRGCSECYHHSPVVNDAVVWQGRSRSCFFSSANKTNTFLFSCGSKDISLTTDVPRKC